MTAPAKTLSGAQPAVLAREVADFLIELSIALHKHAIYPAGHPLLDQAVEVLVTRTTALLHELRPTITFAVARRQLIIEGVATDPNHPVLTELAQRLFRHHIGALRVSHGVTRDELRGLLTTVSVDAGRLEVPIGLGDPDVLQQWPHLRLFALTFEQLQLLQEEDDETGDAPRRTSAAALWVGLARAALAAEGEELVLTDPSVIAQAINTHLRDEAYDQVVVAYLLQIANELKQRTGREAVALQRRVTALVRGLHTDTLARLLGFGGDAVKRNAFVLAAAQGMSVDAVLELVKAASATSESGISHSMIRMLTKFAAHAGNPTDAMHDPMDAAMRDHVRRLVGEWTLTDPNPDAYGRALEGMAKADPLYPGAARFPCEPDRLVQMGLEIGAAGEQVFEAVDALCAEGRVGDVLTLVDEAPEGWAREAVLERATSPDRLVDLLVRNADIPLVGAMATRLGVAAIDPILDALGEVDERRAEALLDLLAPLGLDAALALWERLPTAPWGMQRLLLAALGRMAERPAAYQPADWTLHPDPAVRREAIRQLLKERATRDDGVQLALLDADPATARLGLAAALQDPPPGVATVLMSRADDDTLTPDLRALAVRAAAATRSAQVAPWLVERVLGPKRLFGRALVDPTPESVAAIEGLATHFAARPEVQPILKLAAKSREDDYRNAATRRPTR